IPVVMLFHPSRAVVLRALAIFERRRHTGMAWAVQRLRHDARDPDVRAAALVVHAGPDDPVTLRTALTDGDDVIRTAALVGLITGNWLAGAEADDALAAIVDRGSDTARKSLAIAIQCQPLAIFEETLDRLAASADLEVRRQAAVAMARMPTPRFL